MKDREFKSKVRVSFDTYLCTQNCEFMLHALFPHKLLEANCESIRKVGTQSLRLGRKYAVTYEETRKLMFDDFDDLHIIDFIDKPCDILVFLMDAEKECLYLECEVLPEYQRICPVLDILSIFVGISHRSGKDNHTPGKEIAQRCGLVYVEYNDVINGASVFSLFETILQTDVVPTFIDHKAQRLGFLRSFANTIDFSIEFDGTLLSNDNSPLGEEVKLLYKQHWDNDSHRDSEIERLILAHASVSCCHSFWNGKKCAFELWCNGSPSLRYSKEGSFLHLGEMEIREITKAKPGLCISLRLIGFKCEEIAVLFRRLPPLSFEKITIVNCPGLLALDFLSTQKSIENLMVINTTIDIGEEIRFSSPTSNLKHLVLVATGLKKIPLNLREFSNLEVLNVSQNNLKHIPTEVGVLNKLKTLQVRGNQLVFPPAQILELTVQEIVQFVSAFQKDTVPNRQSKIVLVGQEGVGKSTLVKAMRRDYWFLEGVEPADKTDGVNIVVLPLKGTRCKVYDLAGDVEYLKTHSLFLSPNCLHLAVFDLSQFLVSKETRSADQLCRLKLWLQTIASQTPKSEVIIVASHADHQLLSTSIVQKIRENVLRLLRKYHVPHVTAFKSKVCHKCMVCNPNIMPPSLASVDIPTKQTGTQGLDSGNGKRVGHSIPHVREYFEVSSIQKYPSAPLSMTNQNLEQLKEAAAAAVTDLTTQAEHQSIPKRWLKFREMHHKLEQPVLTLVAVKSAGVNCEIYSEEEIASMLRFFHSQGEFLWYEDIPEMKGVVITNPQWLSNQLRILINYRSTDAIADGILHTQELDSVWGHLSQDHRISLLSLFRKVGLCFKISDTKEMFPCNLPVGWPDRDMWPPLPRPSENQTSLLFNFNFVPPSFFAALIVAVNKKRESFASNVQPLYYRFHIVYITKEQGLCTYHEMERGSIGACGESSESERSQVRTVLHTVHFKLVPHTNSLKAAVRGPHPCCMLSDIRAMVDSVGSSRFPGIAITDAIVCPECELQKSHTLRTFDCVSPHDGVCAKGHKVRTTQDLLAGNLSPAVVIPSAVATIGRAAGTTLDDKYCPKLFVVLPINLEGLSFKDRFVYSHLRDGYAVHLLCESPSQWHFVDSPGFRIGKPKEFFEKYGGRVCKLLRVIAALQGPLQAASAVDSHCRLGSTAANMTGSIVNDLQSLLENYLATYPHLKASVVSWKDDTKDLKSSRGLQRSELARFLEMAAKGREFGPLVCTYVDKYND